MDEDEDVVPVPVPVPIEGFDRHLFVKCVSYGIDLTILLASLTFFYKFTKTRNKPPGLYMIFILCILDLSYPILNSFATLLVLDEISATKFGSLRTGLNRASLNWSMIIALHCYFILVKRKTFNSFRFMIFGGFFGILASLICPLILLKKMWGIHAEYIGPGLFRLAFADPANSNPKMFFIFYDFFGTLLPVFIISFCYMRVYKFLKFLKSLAVTYSKINTTKILIYIFIPILCYGPQIISDMIYTSRKRSSPFWMAFIISTLRRSWGVLNLLAFWFTSVDGNENRDSLLNQSQRNLSLANYQESNNRENDHI